jgi:hypothetical protein
MIIILQRVFIFCVGKLTARLIDCHFYSPGPVPIGSSSMNAFGSEVQRFQRRDYSAINDPHLYDFFVRKFTNMERLTPALPDRVGFISVRHVFVSNWFLCSR